MLTANFGKFANSGGELSTIGLKSHTLTQEEHSICENLLLKLSKSTILRHIGRPVVPGGNS